MGLIKKFRDLISQDIGIDLGTRNTVAYLRGVGVVVREPSMVAIDQKSGTVMAIGYEAYNMIGRTPGNIIAVRPMKDGVIADFDMTEKMVREFVKKINEGRRRFGRPRILLGIPWGITPVEKRAVSDAAYQAGAKEALLIDEPMAAAIGAGLPVETPKGHMIIDIGGGTTEVAVISLAGIVVCHSIRIAGDEFDEAIVSHCRKNYNLLIGERMAERVKFEIGSAYPYDEEKSMQVKGRDLVSGMPRTFTISSYEIRDALSECVEAIADTVRLTLEKTPPELAGDIAEHGILMTGGGSLLYGITKYIQEEVNIPVRLAEDPLSAVAVGTGMVLEDTVLMERISSTICK